MPKAVWLPEYGFFFLLLPFHPRGKKPSWINILDVLLGIAKARANQQNPTLLCMFGAPALVSCPCDSRAYFGQPTAKRTGAYHSSASIRASDVPDATEDADWLS